MTKRNLPKKLPPPAPKIDPLVKQYQDIFNSNPTRSNFIQLRKICISQRYFDVAGLEVNDRVLVNCNLSEDDWCQPWFGRIVEINDDDLKVLPINNAISVKPGKSLSEICGASGISVKRDHVQLVEPNIS